MGTSKEMITNDKWKRSFAFIGAATGWFAILTQFIIFWNTTLVSKGETILRFFGYFTIDTNILVALCFTAIAFNGRSKLSDFFTSASTLTAATVFILIVGIVYNLLLRSLWSPQGFQKLADELLHSIIPLLMPAYWLLFISTKELNTKNILSWLIYPVIYMIYGLIHGAITKFYPYPFVDVTKLGYSKTLLNSAIILIVMIILIFAFISLGKLIKRPNKKVAH